MPLTIGLAVGAPVVGGALGNLFGSGDQKAAADAKKAALQQFLNINTPSIEEQRIALQHLQSAGTLNPQAEGLVTQGPSEMKNINVDPRLMQAQMQALSQLQQVGSGGFTARQRADLNQERMQAAGDAQSQQQSILQNMAARGVAGSGTELAARLSAAQSAANRGAQMGDRTAAMAQTNALNAISQAGGLSSQMNSQQFSQQAQQAQAADAIAAFNARNRQNVMGTNTAAANQAAQYNLQNNQRISDANTGLANQQEMYNKGLYQQQFNDQMQKAYGAAGQDQHMADYYGQQANATRGMYSGIGNSLGAAGTAFGVQKIKNQGSSGSSSGSSSSSENTFADYDPTKSGKVVTDDPATGIVS